MRRVRAVARQQGCRCLLQLLLSPPHVSKQDRLAMSLETRSVTGNWPLLHFPECEGEFASKKLETFKVLHLRLV